MTIGVKPLIDMVVYIEFRIPNKSHLIDLSNKLLLLIKVH